MSATRTAGLSTSSYKEIDDLRSEMSQIIGVVMALIGGLGVWLMTPSFRYEPGPFALAAALLGTGVFTLALARRHPRLARLGLALGSALVSILQIQHGNPATSIAYGLLLVVANGLVHPLWGGLVALAGTVALAVFGPGWPAMLAPASILWLGGGLMVLPTRTLWMALTWSWQSQERSQQLLSQLRFRQGELNRTNIALVEASRRLQRVTQQLAIERLRADEAREMKERFAANISHELRTPLNLILGFSEMMYLRSDVYGDMAWPMTLRRDVRQIYQSSRQLLDLVNDVLDLARIDALQFPLLKELGDLGDVIREAASTASDLLRGTDVALQVELPASLPPFQFDRTRIRQVLLNLLNNASRFTLQGSITIRATVEGDEAVVTVTDTGVGIPADRLDDIFEEFRQVDMSPRRQHGGAGLGLALCKRFVELHDGRIWAESEPGVGSTFRFTLPLTQLPATALREAVVPPRPVTGPQPQLLVLDPDPGVGTMLRRYLKDTGVLQARDARQARQMVAEWHPKAVLVNTAPGQHALPELWELAGEVTPPQVPVLACALPSSAWIVTEAQVHNSLAKPVTRETLLGAVQAAVPESVHANGRPARVLVVDDDRGFVQMVERYLQTANEPYDVSRAYNGAEALQRLQQGPRPDVVLLDLVMPVMDGFAFLERVQEDERYQGLPIIIVTVTSFLEEMLAHRGSEVTLLRRQGLRPSEVLAYLQALLDATEASYPSGIAEEPEAGDPA
jgi:signal transduction histidine kinase/DNA-binding response OmpR family regulator